MIVDESDEELPEMGQTDDENSEDPKVATLDFKTSLQHDNIQRQLAKNAVQYQKGVETFKNPKVFNIFQEI